MPRIEYKLTLGNIVQTIIFVASMSYAYAQMSSKVDYMDTNGTKIVRELLTEMNGLRLELAVMRADMKSAKEQSEKLERKLERFEETNVNHRQR
jgi:hypothetical protein